MGSLQQGQDNSRPPARERGHDPQGLLPHLHLDLRTVAGEYVYAAIPDEIESGNLRAPINLSGHILTCMPDTPRFNAALERLEGLATMRES